MKRIISLLIVLFISFSFSVDSHADLVVRNHGDLNNFSRTKSFYGFSDVSGSSWYYGSIGLAYSYGLMNGISSYYFNPNDSITLAETIAIASRLHNIYYGNDGVFKEGNPWYKVYVDYFNNHIIKNTEIDLGELSEYNEPVTREQFVKLISAAFTQDIYLVFPSINSESDLPSGIPDVKYCDANFPIYRLYYAGILTGNDVYGTFNPYSNIKRSEVAAILIRTIFPAERKKFTLQNEIAKYRYENSSIMRWIDQASLVDFCEQSVQGGYGYRSGLYYIFSDTRRYSESVNSYNNTKVITSIIVNYYNKEFEVRTDYETISLGESYSDYCLFSGINNLDKAKWYTKSKMLSTHKKISNIYTMKNIDLILSDMADAILKSKGYNVTSNYGRQYSNYCHEQIEDMLSY